MHNLINLTNCTTGVFTLNTAVLATQHLPDLVEMKHEPVGKLFICVKVFCFVLCLTWNVFGMSFFLSKLFFNYIKALSLLKL